MRTAFTLGMAAALTLAFVTLAAPPAAADPDCHDVLCCESLESSATLWLQCVVCVDIGGEWDAGTDQCFLK